MTQPLVYVDRQCRDQKRRAVPRHEQRDEFRRELYLSREQNDSANKQQVIPGADHVPNPEPHKVDCGVSRARMDAVG